MHTNLSTKSPRFIAKIGGFISMVVGLKLKDFSPVGRGSKWNGGG